MNNLNLIESRIDTFLKVHNALIHPNYYDTNLNLKSQQHQLNEMNFDLKRLTLNTQINNSLLSDKYGSSPNKSKKEDQPQNPSQFENPKVTISPNNRFQNCSHTIAESLSSTKTCSL